MLLVGQQEGHVARVQKNPGFLKKPKPVVLGVFIVFRVFRIFYSNEHLGSSLADLAHQLSFYLD